MKNENSGLGSIFVTILPYVYLTFSWLVNAYQFFCLDFEPSYKEEIIKALGLFIPPLSGVTVWF